LYEPHNGIIYYCWIPIPYVLTGNPSNSIDSKFLNIIIQIFVIVYYFWINQ
jgi:hypothetical protein